MVQGMEATLEEAELFAAIAASGARVLLSRSPEPEPDAGHTDAGRRAAAPKLR
jgi:hypothetical protein